MEAPRYRVTKAIAPMGIPYDVGAEIKVTGWPQLSHVEPINESARRVADWLRRYQFASGKPATPRNDLVGDFYLPGVLAQHGPEPIFNAVYDKPKSSTISPARENEVVEGMPRYKSSQDQLLGKTSVPSGTEFCFLGWPLDSFVPVNKSAKAVTAYLAKNKGDPALLPSPWCCYRQDVVLPELPPVKDEKKERKRERAEAHEAFEAMGLDVREVR